MKEEIMKWEKSVAKFYEPMGYFLRKCVTSPKINQQFPVKISIVFMHQFVFALKRIIYASLTSIPSILNELIIFN